MRMGSDSAPTVSQARETVGPWLGALVSLRATLRWSLFVLALEGATVPAIRVAVGSASLDRSTGRPHLRVATKQPESAKRKETETAMTTSTSPAGASGTFVLGGDLTVTRLGYGTMQLTGPGIWGEPRDRTEAIRVLRRAAELGVDLFDTADSYGPFVAEDLLRKALHPYQDITIA